MNTFFIVDHRARLIGNRLLSDMSIRACALEVGARVIDLSFLEHTPFIWVIDTLTRRRALWAMGAPKCLPPEAGFQERFQKQHTLYFFGWMFRNPAGLAKYRTELLGFYQPPSRMQKKIDALLAPLQGKRLIGVHLKLTPFRGFEDGEFLVSRRRVQEIVSEYVRRQGLKETEVALIEVSDTGPHKDDLQGLHLLSRCSVVIGTNTTFANVAAWFGNVPHIVTTNAPIDWSYYEGKNEYVENKYATFAL